MYILGINAYHGDSSACLLQDGVVICATEEERFRRIKHWAGFPSESIKFCLEDEGITIEAVDYITISRDPKANFYKKIRHVLQSPPMCTTTPHQEMKPKRRPQTVFFLPTLEDQA